jgi:hypothetical protein
VLKERVAELRKEEALTLANTMLRSSQKANQRHIDEMRGFWRGVDWFIRETKRGANVFNKGVEQE